MRLFLSSSGICNDSLAKAFTKLVSLPAKEIKIAFIPTAANIVAGDKGWLIDDYANLKKQSYEVDIVDISALPQELWLPRIESAHVIFLGGGNSFHLMYWVEKSGLQDKLPELLKTKVYAGISAGSCIAGPTIANPVQDLYDETYDIKITAGLNLVDFHTVTHLNSEYFPKIRLEQLTVAAKELGEPVYALDDNSAVICNDDTIEIVSEGVWKMLA